ncbi:MAG: oligosaccharide flippase family protein, partial [Selenomonadaceae bacterium]|nr:oligosaccharide flippase family protein [Selenomonadaceae bacterium]
MINRLTQNIFSLLTLKGVDYVLNFVMLPFLLRMLGAERFGAIVFMQSVVQYMVVAVEYGFNMTAPRDIARASDERSIAKIFSNVMAAKILIATGLLALTVVALVLMPSTVEFDVLLLMAVLPTVLGNIAFPIWFFQGIQQMKFITVSVTVARLLILLSMFATVRSPDDYLIAALLQSSMTIVAGLLAFGIIVRSYRYVFVRPTFEGVIEALRDGKQIFISTVAINLYTTTNVVLLGLLTNPTAVGYFGAANKLIDSVKGLMGAFSSAVYPHVSAKVRESPRGAIEFIKKFGRWYSGAFLVVSTLMFVLARPIVEILFGAGYEQTIEILRLMAWLPFVIALSNV